MSPLTPLALALVLAASPHPSPPPFPSGATDDAARDERHAAVVELLDAGSHAEAWDAARLALEHRPEDAELLALASRAAEAAGKPDLALYHATLALDHVDAEEAKELEARRTALRERLAALDPEEGAARAALEAYAAELLEVAEVAHRRKLYVNEVDILTRLEGTHVEGRASDMLERVYKSSKAVQALLDSGLDVPLAPARRRVSEETQARLDEKHSEWEDAWELKGENYTVITNLPGELGERMLSAMEQMNGFYRQVFDYRLRGGGMARCTLTIYRHRSEFDAEEGYGDRPSVQGFFSPSENRVAAFDPRTTGGTLADLWDTLFHEASHQFTRTVSTGVIPGWLNEGTATYFEGARLLPNGTVEKNLVPESRLRALVALLDAGTVKLGDVVAYFSPGSYDGSFYPFGWGLVYMFHNWEDEDAERVYLPLYQEYMDTYRSGGKHDPVARFEEYFIERAGLPGVTDFASFEEHFERYVRGIHELHFGPPAMADRLIERAENQRAHEKWAAADESLRWALRKRPGDARARYLLAQVNLELDREDNALYELRHAFEAARGLGAQPVPGMEDTTGDELAALCLERITKLDRHVGEAFAEIVPPFVERVAEVAGGYAEAGYPWTAVRTVDDALGMVGSSAALADVRSTIASAHGVDTRRWRRVPLDEETWFASKGWEPTDGALALSTENLEWALVREEPPHAFTYEARIAPRADTAAGIVFGYGGDDPRKLFYRVGETPIFRVARYDEGKQEPIATFQAGDAVKGDVVLLGIEVHDGQVDFLVNGQVKHTEPLDLTETRGHVGVWGQAGSVRVTDVRLRY